MRVGQGVAGVRAVGVFEAAKGVVVLIAGLGLLSLVHRDAQHAAETIVRHLHLNPARHYPRVRREPEACRRIPARPEELS